MSSTVAKHHLDVWDYVVCAVVLFLTTIMGIYHTIKARKAKNLRNFLVSDSSIGFVPLIMSLIATYVSAIGVLGFPVDTYTYGFIFSSMALASFINIPFGIYIFLPVYCYIKGGTLFEFLERRFNRSIRLTCSIALTFKSVLYSSVAIYAPSLAINQATGLHTWLSVALIGAICVVYTSLGGIKAVIWADATQLLVIVLILWLVLIKGIIDVGGVATVFNINVEGGRFDITRSDMLYTWWVILLAYPLHHLGSTVANQTMVQRFVSKPTLRENIISFVGGTVGVIFIQFFMMSLGFIIYAKYHGCDPLLNNDVTSRDQLLVFLAMDTLKFCKGLPGLFVAGILCATLSTLSSTLNSMATVTIEDYILPFKKNLSQATVIKLSKIIAILYGFVSVGFVAVVQNLGGIIQAVFCLTGMIHGPIVASLTVGMLLPWVDVGAIWAGLIAALSVTSWAAIGSMIVKFKHNHLPFSTHLCHLNSSVIDQQFLPFDSSMIIDPSVNQSSDSQPLGLYAVSSIWYSSWSFIIVIVVSQVYTVLFGTNKKLSEMDPKIISKFARVLISKLPVTWRRKLGFTEKIDQIWFGFQPKVVETVKTNGSYQSIQQIEGDAVVFGT